MGGRIITMQRQARELGRLRTGWTDTSGAKSRPVKSETWVVTSHALHYVEAAATLWGGKVEKWQPLGNQPQQWRVITEAQSIDAILPPGDPLSQSNELWSKGGCSRRCDGVTEQLSDRPCLCAAEFGDTWFERSKGTVCSPTTRLNVMLPDLPDLGVYRVETHGYYAANEIAGQVDMLLSATGGRALVPVSLRIEPRQRVAQGQTKKFPVIVVEVRGMTARQALAGDVPQLAVEAGQAQGRAAIEAAPAAPPAVAGPPKDFLALARAAGTEAEVRGLYDEAKDAGAPADYLAQLSQIGMAKSAASASAAAPETSAGPPTGDVHVAEPVDGDDPTEVWFQIIAAAGALGWDTATTESEFAAANGGLAVASASTGQLRGFLADVKARARA